MHLKKRSSNISMCFLTGMFPLPNSLFLRDQPAFAQGPVSSAQISSGLLTLFTRHGVAKTHLIRNHQLLTRGSKRHFFFRLAIPNILLTFIHNYTDRHRDSNLRICFPTPIYFTYLLYILKMAVSSYFCIFPLIPSSPLFSLPSFQALSY
jgi:hypothetical protein